MTVELREWPSTWALLLAVAVTTAIWGVGLLAVLSLPRSARLLSPQGLLALGTGVACVLLGFLAAVLQRPA